MGNTYAKPELCPDERFLEVVQNGGNLQELLLREALKEETLVEVDMGFDHSTSAWKDRHDIVFSEEKPDSHYLVLLFPCHPLIKKQTLYTHAYSDVCALNREVNERMRESQQVSFAFGVVRLVILYGSVMYCIRNVVGTTYLVWAQTLTQTNDNHVPIKVIRNVPLLVNMDGWNQYTSLLLLHPEKEPHSDTLLSRPLNVHTCRFYVPFRTFLWTDEADPREHRRQLEEHVVVATAQQVESSYPGQQDRQRALMRREPPPFSPSEAEHTPRDNLLDEMDSDEEIVALGQDFSLSLGDVTTRTADEALPQFAGMHTDAESSWPDETF